MRFENKSSADAHSAFALSAAFYKPADFEEFKKLLLEQMVRVQVEEETD